jgi:hypothetical protein
MVELLFVRMSLLDLLLTSTVVGPDPLFDAFDRQEEMISETFNRYSFLGLDQPWTDVAAEAVATHLLLNRLSRSPPVRSYRVAFDPFFEVGATPGGQFCLTYAPLFRVILHQSLVEKDLRAEMRVHLRASDEKRLESIFRGGRSDSTLVCRPGYTLRCLKRLDGDQARFLSVIGLEEDHLVVASS